MLKAALKSPKKCNHAQSKMEAKRNSALLFVDINVYVSPECHSPWTLTLKLPILGVVVMAETASPLLTDDSVQCSAERRAAVLQCG